MKINAKWYDNGLQLIKWSSADNKLLKKIYIGLRDRLLPLLSPYCMNLKGRGGVKGAVRLIYRKLEFFPFAARLDVKSFYGSICHNVLFRELNKLNICTEHMNIIREYVELPDTENRGLGIAAGGTLSSLLGAVYLSPVDRAMDKLFRKGDIFYLRYADDIIILAKSRWKLKNSLKLIYSVLDSLELKVHKVEKCFIGKTEKGFEFLGYYFNPGSKLTPSLKSLEKFARHAGRLAEQGGGSHRLLSYAGRFLSYFCAGLKPFVSFSKLHRMISGYLKYRI